MPKILIINFGKGASRTGKKLCQSIVIQKLQFIVPKQGKHIEDVHSFGKNRWGL